MFQIRTSERSTFKRCPQRWVWSYEQGLTPIRNKPALWFGSAFHVALAEWYGTGTQRGPHPTETILKTIGEGRKILVTNEDEERVYVDALELGEDMTRRYVEHYGRDEKMSFIATEQTFQVWIPHPNRPGKWLRYVGTADGVYLDLETGEVWLIEHKTAAQIKTTHLPLDDQAGSYWAVMNSKLRKIGVLKPGQSIAGIMYNFARKATDDDRPKNADGLATNKPLKQHYIDAITAEMATMPDKRGGSWIGPGLTGKEKLEDLHLIADKLDLTVLGEVSAVQPAPYHERFPVYRSIAQRRKMIARIQAEGLHMEAIRNGTMPVYKTPTRDCDWQCEFFRLCQMDEEGAEFFEDYKEAEFTTRDPYEDHRNRKSTDS